MLYIEKDIRQATTPSADLYINTDWYRVMQSQVFARSWQFIGDLNNTPSPGYVHPFTLLPGCLDEALVLTHDHDGQRHCLSNVCTHRGNIICQANSQRDDLRCPYHSRRFELNGTFRFAPGFEQAKDFPRPSDSLPALPLQQWGPLLFTAIDPAHSFETWLGPIKDRLHWLPIDDFVFSTEHSKDYLIEANWALYCENYLDSLHIPYIHPELTQTLDFKQYRTELFDYANLQLGFAADGEEAFDLPPDSADYGQRIAAYYFWLYPNLMLNFYPWGLSINIVEPQGVNRIRVRFISYIWQADKLADGAGSILDKVEMQDEAVVLTTQAGLRSRLYHRGRYAPEHEAGCHHFHRLLTSQINQYD